MKLIIVLWVLVLHAFAADFDPKKLEALKKEFPTHVAGPITNKSDPSVKAIWEKYHRAVQALTPDNLSSGVLDLQRTADNEGRDIYARLRNRNNVYTSSARHAAEQNVAWLQQKLIPYLKRIAQFQRGR